jgi:hypothetical protein
MAKPRRFIEPGAELDCAYFPIAGGPEFVRGFLTLPGPHEGGRVRFVEHAEGIEPSTNTIASLPITLLEGASGAPACLIDCFLAGHRFSMPMPAPYPVELFVNAAVIGSDDPDHCYGHATMRCQGLLEFLGVSALTPQQVADGTTSTERANASGDRWGLTLDERAETTSDDRSFAIEWSGEITIRGEPKTLRDWRDRLYEVLVLFAFLADKPLMPERLLTKGRSGTVDYYVVWQKVSASSRTNPLFALGHVESEFGEIVSAWLRLCDQAHDLVDHLAGFQLRRGLMIQSDQLLLLIRFLEQYHAYCPRFDSRVRPPQEHRALVKTVLDQVSDELGNTDRDWIKQALSEANRKRLLLQLQDILADLGSTITEHCFIADPLAFATISRTARNYFTHPSGEIPADIRDGGDLHVLIQRLWFVVRACVLVELGLSRDAIADALKRSGQRHYLLK